MYRFSRSIYRELSPYLIEDDDGQEGNGHSNGYGHPNGNGRANGSKDGNGATNRQQLLDACEATMRRLAYDRRYFARPTRSLFCDVRFLFPIAEQKRVYLVIERNINLALEYLAQLPEGAVGLDGHPSECRAHTRKGTPCQRQPLPGRDYCPSHKHLEECMEAMDEELTAMHYDPEKVDELDKLAAAA
jgi:hypothetical protein